MIEPIPFRVAVRTWARIGLMSFGGPAGQIAVMHKMFLGAPFVESLRSNRTIQRALGAITGAVVGVILNLSVWFGLHVVFGTVTETHAGPLRLWIPDVSTTSWPALVIAAAALVATLRFKVAMGWVLGAAALAGLAWTLAT